MGEMRRKRKSVSVLARPCVTVVAVAWAVLAAANALAQPSWREDVEGWAIRKVVGQRSCSGEAVYQDGMRFRIGLVGPDRRIVLIFGKSAWNDVRQGVTYKLRFVFDGQKTWTGDAIGAKMGGIPGLVIDPVKDAFFADFMNYNNLAMFHENRPLGSFSLKGTSAALTELRRCHEAAAGMANAAPASVPKLSLDGMTPISCIGALGRDSDLQTVDRTFGSTNVQRRVERDAAAGSDATTIVFPDDPAKRIEIVWRNATAMRRPASIHFADGNRVKIAGMSGLAVGIGSTLAEVESANGVPFKLSAFNSMDGGLVTPVGWRGGVLSQVTGGCTLYVRFRPGRADAAEIAEVTGITELHSNTPALRRVQPVVASMELYWPPDIGEERLRRLRMLLE